PPERSIEADIPRRRNTGKHRGPLDAAPGETRFLPTRLVGARAATLHGGLESASCLELGHRSGRDLNLLARARVHTHAGCSALCRELPEAGEVHLAAAR